MNVPAPPPVGDGHETDDAADRRSAQQRAYDAWLAHRPSPVDLLRARLGPAPPGLTTASATASRTPRPGAGDGRPESAGSTCPDGSAAAAADASLAIAMVMRQHGCGVRAAAVLIRERAAALGVHPGEVAASMLRADRGTDSS